MFYHADYGHSRSYPVGICMGPQKWNTGALSLCWGMVDPLKLAPSHVTMQNFVALGHGSKIWVHWVSAPLQWGMTDPLQSLAHVGYRLQTFPFPNYVTV